MLESGWAGVASVEFESSEGRAPSPIFTIPACLSAIIIGYVAAGPGVVAVMVGAALLVVAVLVWSPALNDRIYMGKRPTDVVLAVPAANERRDGRLEITERLTLWRPWNRYHQPPTTIRSGEIKVVRLRPRRGLPKSCRIVIETGSDSFALTVFATASKVEAAFRQAG